MSGRKAKRHDCGAHGMLTADEISTLSGLSSTAIYGRLANGITGDALLSRDRRGRGKGAADDYTTRSIHTAGTIRVAVAVQIARKFNHRPPTVEELQREFDMSRATAYRWRAAFVDAMGLAA